MVGARLPVEDLFTSLQGRTDIGAIYRAGDCLSPGTIQASVLSGHKVARDILDPVQAEAPFKREQVIQAG
jgi:hypothetical protein